ncbi:site-specific integrase [soil metagenome]
MRRSHGEGTLYRDATRDRWVGQVWIGGRRRKVTARTKREATAKLGSLVHGDNSERLADRKVTVRALLADWTTVHLAGRDLAPSTRTNHAWAAAHLTTQLGHVRVADLDVRAVEAALWRLSGPPRYLSKASLVKVRQSLRQALAWAERRRMVGHNAAAVAELPATATPARTRRALTRDELARLLDALDGHPLATMFALGARVGLRPGEAAAVCGDAVDATGDPATVAVVRAVQLVGGRPVLTDSLKTTRARRTLAIPGDLAARLAPIAATARTGLLYRAPDGGPLWPGTARAVLFGACDAAGVARITPNELRHTAATHLADGGLPPHQVADLLGHASTRMLDEVYRHRPPVIRGAEGS